MVLIDVLAECRTCDILTLEVLCILLMAWHGQASAVGGKGDTVSSAVLEAGLVCNQGLCTIMSLYLYSVTEQRNLMI